jgi:hypothetical protein
MRKIRWRRARGTPALAGALAGVVLSVGCVSSKIDWNSRVGVYTYDQAVVELGPPDRAATLSTGATVAEWLTRRGYSGVYGGYGYGYGYARPYYYRPYYSGPAYYYYDAPGPDYFLRLTFDPAGRLTEWKRVAR